MISSRQTSKVIRLSDPNRIGFDLYPGLRFVATPKQQERDEANDVASAIAGIFNPRPKDYVPRGFRKTGPELIDWRDERRLRRFG